MYPKTGSQVSKYNLLTITSFLLVCAASSKSLRCDDESGGGEEAFQENYTMGLNGNISLKVRVTLCVKVLFVLMVT